MLNRQQNCEVTTRVLHHYILVGLAYRLGGFVHNHAAKNFLTPCEPDGLEIAHLQILLVMMLVRPSKWQFALGTTP